MSSAGRYYHTVRHLKPVQIFGRIWFHLYKPGPDFSPAPPLAAPSGRWTPPIEKRRSLVDVDSFQFLSAERKVSRPEDWNSVDADKLWLYNLHYFDDLNARDAGRRRAWHDRLLVRWVVENPPGHGNGWEPYCLSLRIVNWVKWALAGGRLDGELLESLAIQVRYLSKRVEWHLLGNHLLANAKALFFAGLFFEGPEPKRWLIRSAAILEKQIKEQFLSDGGHFERSPMYHAILLEDLLDLVNMATAYEDRAPQGLLERLKRTASEAIPWMWNLVHPDGEIALFNDAAFGIAASPGDIEAYSRRLGMQKCSIPQSPIQLMAQSGFARLAKGPAVLMADVGRVGPDYLPAHAHADTLSFELSVFDQRVVVDTGTSSYVAGEERHRQRATAAHNTVVINRTNSSDVWAAFRVGRRAMPIEYSATHDADALYLTGAHDGYCHLPGRPIHRRRWILTADGLTIEDTLDGRWEEAVAYLHFHPSVRVCPSASDALKICLSDGHELNARFRGGRPVVSQFDYHPEFGVSKEATCVELPFEEGTLVSQICWGTS